MDELRVWEALLDTGTVTHVRPRKWCGVWQLLAYNRNLPIPLVGGVTDTPAAHDAVRNRGISIEDLHL